MQYHKGSIILRLTACEIARGIRVGSERYEYHERRNTRNTYNLHHDPYNDRHISQIGAIGELAVAITLGVEDEWVECTDDYHALLGDVMPGVEVRTTRHHEGNLLLHPRDRDDRAYVSCRIERVADIRRIREVEIVGWQTGRNGKQERNWWTGANGNRPCYRIARADLIKGTRTLIAWQKRNHAQ